MKPIVIDMPTIVYLKFKNELTTEMQNKFIESSLFGEEPFLLLGFESQKDNPATGRFFEVVDMVAEDNFSIDIHSDVIVLYVKSHNEKIIDRFTKNLRSCLDVDFDVMTDKDDK